MKMYGTASVYGVDGTCAIDGAAAIAAKPESVEGTDQATVEESLDGNGELDGFNIRDNREVINLTLMPKKAAGTGSLNDAKLALVYPPIPAKITLAGFITTSGTDALEINGDYIYTGGAQRSVLRGNAVLRLTCFKPITSGKTVTELLTEAV